MGLTLAWYCGCASSQLLCSCASLARRKAKVQQIHTIWIGVIYHRFSETLISVLF